MFRKPKNKGDVQYIMYLGIGLIMLIAVSMIYSVSIQGVQTVMSTPTGALGGAYGNCTNSVADAITLFSVSPIILGGAVIALSMLLSIQKFGL